MANIGIKEPVQECARSSTGRWLPYAAANVELTRRPQTLPEGREVLCGRVERLVMLILLVVSNLLCCLMLYS